MTTHLQDGARGEDLACAHLVRNGLVLLERNWHSRYGEIDLIMYDGEILVFVEVRYRRDSRFLTALDSIGPLKCHRLTRAASSYLSKQIGDDPPQCRFDVVTVSGAHPRSTIRWVRDAFSMAESFMQDPS